MSTSRRNTIGHYSYVAHELHHVINGGVERASRGALRKHSALIRLPRGCINIDNEGPLLELGHDDLGRGIGRQVLDAADLGNGDDGGVAGTRATKEVFTRVADVRVGPFRGLAAGFDELVQSHGGGGPLAASGAPAVLGVGRAILFEGRVAQ